jgi:hypothetical protein
MSSNLTSLRVQLHALGYNILPNIGKVPAIKGWNTPEYLTRELLSDAAVDKIPRWPLRWPGAETTGVRLDDLVVIDIDVDDMLAAIVMDAIADIAPGVFAAAPCRFGASSWKRALFCRLADGEEPFRRLASHKYEEASHCVEVFGGGRLKGDKCSRQFGIYGPHSYNADGSVAAEYRWDDVVPALREIPHADLPRITRAQCAAIADAFDTLATEAGWSRQVPVRDGLTGARIYDIDEETRFEVLGHDELLPYEDLEEGMRCASSFFDNTGHNRSKCHVGHSPLHDCIMVYDYEAEAAHYPKQFAAPDPGAFAEQMAAVLPPNPAEAPPPRPDDKAPLGEKVAWLLATRGYCEQTDRVIELHKAGEDCQTRRIAFQFAFRSWYVTTIGPRGGENNAYATSGWEMHASRPTLEGVRLRPDRPFPVYEEGGRLYKNTYQRPQHVGTGDLGVWHRFMQHLLPDPAEHDWFMDWLAHKHRHPAVPGVAVIMVAANEEGPVYGAGRGMLRDILARLFGTQYVRTIDFDVFSGKSAQGVYTDWAAYSLLVTVSEAKDSADAGRWTERRAVYERIKEIVDPRAVERMFTSKGLPSFVARAFTSYLIFSNNFDAVQLPPDDRRATVLRNGVKMPPAMAAELEAWMEQPGNIAALSAWLDRRGLSGFSVYDPLDTATKTRMQELARSDVDEAFDRVRRALGPHALFTGDMIRLAILGELDHTTETIDAQIKRRVKSTTQKVEGEHRMPRSMSLGNRPWILCWHGGPQLVVSGADEAVTRVGHATKLLEAMRDGTGAGAQIIDLRRS